jgi:hypothetical protein
MRICSVQQQTDGSASRVDRPPDLIRLTVVVAAVAVVLGFFVVVVVLGERLILGLRMGRWSEVGANLQDIWNACHVPIDRDRDSH